MTNNDSSELDAAAGLATGMEEVDSFYMEDICSLRAEPGHIGVIERTTGDIDSHSPHPHMEYRGLTCHKDISWAVFRKFKHDGIPPTGTVLVAWQTKPNSELIPTKHLTLTDRSLLVGDIVKKRAKDAMSGTVTQTSMLCVLRRSAFKDARIRNGAFEEPPLAQTVPFLVSATDLEHAKGYGEGDLIIFHDWVGRIEDVYDSITLRLSNGNIVEVEDSTDIEHLADNEVDRCDVGDIARTRKANLRRGIWKVGRYDPAVEPLGDIVQVKPTHFHARWLWNHASDQPLYDRSSEPPIEMTVSIFENEGGKVYNASRTPLHTRGSHTSHIPFISGDKVRFKDPAGAAVKYPEFNRIPASETNGFDLNVFTIQNTKTTASVLWQDRVEERLAGTAVVPDYNIDDDSDVWPADVVMTKESVPVPGEDWIFQPKRVGVVQSVSPVDRIAQIKWFPRAHIQYNQVGLDQHLDELSLLSGSSLGLSHFDGANCPIEDVTLYDIKPVGAISRRRGDYVVIHEPGAEGQSYPGAHNVQADIDWFGEVISLNLDGTVTVRLGAANQVRDIKISPEYTRLVHSTDVPSLTIPGDYGDDSYDSENEDEFMHDSDFGSMSDSSEVESDVGTWMIDGKPVEDEDEEWATEDEDSELESGAIGDEDLEMADIDCDNLKEEDEPQANLMTRETPALPVGLSDTTTDQTLYADVGMEQQESSIMVRGTKDAPPAFEILECEPAATHNYLYPDPPALTGARMRRIRKEHAILQSSLPEGIFVRTWESRLDLLRVLIVGPLGTPYEYAPFVIDLRIPSDYPQSPPDAFFHSWTAGQGPVNPNLYENGRICLSLLGTWHAGEKGEAWSSRSTILQVLVSILGLVLVKEPYYNEAGFEARAGSEDARIPSQRYSERTYFNSRAFITHAVRQGLHSFGDVVEWLYTSRTENAPSLLDKAIDAAKELIRAGDSGTDIRAGLQKMSKGAIIMLQRQLSILEDLNQNSEAKES